MRKQLLLSTGIVCLMLAPAVSYGQTPGGRGEEQKQTRPGDAGKGAASQERGAERMQERAQGAEQKAQGAAGREERGSGSRQTEERTKAAPSSERPSTASDDKRGRGDDAKSSERAQDSRQGGRDAQTAREGEGPGRHGRHRARRPEIDANQSPHMLLALAYHTYTGFGSYSAPAIRKAGNRPPPSRTIIDHEKYRGARSVD